jgi:hypothetical protein
MKRRAMQKNVGSDIVRFALLYVFFLCPRVWKERLGNKIEVRKKEKMGIPHRKIHPSAHLPLPTSKV